MNNKLYFSLSYSVEISELNYQFRGLHSLFTIVNKAPTLHSTSILLDYKIKRYIVPILAKMYNIDARQICHEINDHGINKIVIQFFNGNKVPVLYWKLHFDGYVRPGKQPSSKTAVIISRMYPYCTEIEWLADILR